MLKLLSPLALELSPLGEVGAVVAEGFRRVTGGGVAALRSTNRIGAVAAGKVGQKCLRQQQLPNLASGNSANAIGNVSRNAATGYSAKAFGNNSSNLASGDSSNASGDNSFNIANGRLGQCQRQQQLQPRQWRQRQREW